MSITTHTVISAPGRQAGAEIVGGNFQSATRIQQSLLAAPERRALLWLAERTPAWINSDHLTALAFLSMLAAGVGYAWARWRPAALWLVVACLALNWLGDSLDGTLARHRNRQRPRYGFYVDHVCDAFGALFLLAGLALSRYMSPPVALGLLVAFLLLSVEIHLATYVNGVFRMSYWQFGGTELRMLLIIGNIYLLYRPWTALFGRRVLLFDIGGVIGIAGMICVTLLSALRNAASLYRQERLP